MYVIVRDVYGFLLKGAHGSIRLPTDLSDLEMLVEAMVDHLNTELPEGVYFSFDEYDGRDDTSSDWRDETDDEDNGEDSLSN